MVPGFDRPESEHQDTHATGGQKGGGWAWGEGGGWGGGSAVGLEIKVGPVEVDASRGKIARVLQAAVPTAQVTSPFCLLS